MSASRRIMLFTLLFALLLAAAWGVWQISKIACWQPFGDVVCRVEAQEKIVALSFDDGPTDAGVDALLPVLQAHGVTATFFVIGDEIARNPDAARRIAAAGHELGNHTMTHRRMIGRMPPTYAGELAGTDDLIRAAGAPRPTLVRPPYFQRLWGFSTAVERAGQRMVTADVFDSMDPGLSAEDYAEDILARVRPGSIILIHPMYASGANAREAVPLLLQQLKERGYRIVAVSELLATAEGLASG